MGTFAVTLGVADPQGRRYEELESCPQTFVGLGVRRFRRLPRHRARDTREGDWTAH